MEEKTVYLCLLPRRTGFFVGGLLQAYYSFYCWLYSEIIMRNVNFLQNINHFSFFIIKK